MPVARKIRCCLTKIEQHNDSVFTLLLEPEKKIPKFLPGQFLHLSIDDYDHSGFWPESRIFSIAGYSEEENLIRISYSVKGYFTGRMKRELYENKKIWIKMPYGDFVIREEKNIVLIAGGTGITAFTAFVDSMDKNCRNDVYLVYGVRNKTHFIYMDMIERKKKENPRFHPYYFLENKPGHEDRNEFYADGVISIEKIWDELKDPEDSVYYLSGPPVMIQTVRKGLIRRGLSDSSIKIDAWE